MIIEKVQRSEETKTKVSNVMITLTAEEGKKLINQDYLDYKNGTWKGEGIPDLMICSKIYLGIEDSELRYAEIDETTANEYQEEWDKALEEGINNPINSDME